jgi:hypothetical protein
MEEELAELDFYINLSHWTNLEKSSGINFVSQPTCSLFFEQPSCPLFANSNITGFEEIENEDTEVEDIFSSNFSEVSLIWETILDFLSQFQAFTFPEFENVTKFPDPMVLYLVVHFLCTIYWVIFYLNLT